MSLPFRFPLSDGGVVVKDDAPDFVGSFPKPPADAGTRHLVGLHRATGHWFTLMEVTDLDERAVLRAVSSATQPDLSRAYIRIEDFSAFRIESRVTVRYAL